MQRLLLSIAILLAPCFAPAFSQDKKTGFDDRDAAVTLKWTREFWRPIQQATKDNNELAKASHEKKLDKAIEPFVGKQISWAFPVSSVRADGIRFAPVSINDKSDRIELLISPAAKNKAFAVLPFPADESDWILKLKAGDRVQLTGKISSIQRHVRRAETGVSWAIGFTLSDAKLSQVESATK